ncbi:MAG: hypothetical protein ACHREM_23095 [Polyangiales bacterium]
MCAYAMLEKRSFDVSGAAVDATTFAATAPKPSARHEASGRS